MNNLGLIANKSALNKAGMKLILLGALIGLLSIGINSFSVASQSAIDWEQSYLNMISYIPFHGLTITLFVAQLLEWMFVYYKMTL